jgi:2-polyprenyl-3-methyl-5-hydroxy-6-metoxy-1,4-benzoquinol methylase
MCVMTTAPASAPGIPADYYRRIFEVEERHWWYRGMRRITAAILADRLERPGRRLLDAGCGTGGFLSWAVARTDLARIAGVDIGSAAIELARTRLPQAELHVAPLRSLPFEDASFNLVVSNDVLQHVPEDEVEESLRQLRRVLEPGGALLLRTSGARHFRREREDWRAYDRKTLADALARAQFNVERVTYVNTLLSLYGAARGQSPHAPSESRDGLPRGEPSAFVSAVGGRVLAAEARWLARPNRSLPYGHTLFAVASIR